MKTFQFFRAPFVIMLFSALALWGCNDTPEPAPTPTPEPEPELKNEFVIDGVSTQMKSFFVDNFDGAMLIVMSPIDGFDSWEGIINNGHPSIMVMLDPALMNSSLNLKTETGAFQIVSTLEGAEFELVTVDETSAITAGTMTFNLKDTNAEMTLDMTLTTGTTLKAHGVGTYVPKAAKGALTVNGTAQDIFSSYYDDTEEGSTMLYFSPQRVENGPQIEDAKCRVQMMLDNTLLNGTAFDITKETKTFTLAYIDDFGETAVGITNGYLEGATGTISVAQNAAEVGKYLVAVDVTFGDGTTLKLTYDSVCDPFYVAPSNEYTLQGLNPKPINSVVIEQTSTLWTIYLASETGLTTVAAMEGAADPIKLTIDASLATGEGFGFSSDPMMSITYAGTMYSPANEEHRGTVGAKVEGTTGTITFIEWDITLKGYYNGPVTLIQ